MGPKDAADPAASFKPTFEAIGFQKDVTCSNVRREVLGTKIAGKKAIEILESARNQPMRIPVNPKRNKNT